MGTGGKRPDLNFSGKVRDEESSEAQKGLDNGRLPPEYRTRARRIFDRVMAEIQEEVERKMEEEFIRRDEENGVMDIVTASTKLSNLDSHWEAAARSKPHEEIDGDDLEDLKYVIERVEKSARLELKFNCYLSMVYDRVSDRSIEPGDVAEMLSDEEEKEKVGEYIREATEKAENMGAGNGRENEIIASEVNRRLEEEEEELKADLKSEDKVMKRYRKFLELLKGIEKELDAIEQASEEKPDGADDLRRILRCTVGHTRVTIEERKHLKERIEKAEGARKALSKAFYRGMLR